MPEACTPSNLSVGGCKVHSKASVYIGRYLALDVFLRDEQTRLEVDQAAVRWAKEQEFGLEFISMRPEEEERLLDVVGILRAG